MNSRLFRKVSVERLSSPEQLDELMQVTTPRGWIALLAFAVILLTAIFWGIWGSIPSKVSGQGILIKTGGIFDIATLSSGQITEILVESGDLVEKGQLVARIAQPQLIERLHKARLDLSELQARHADLVAFGSKDLRLQLDYLTQQHQNLTASIEINQQQLKWLEEKVAAQEALFEKGLVTKQSLLTTRQSFYSTREKIDQSRNELKQIDVRILALRNQKQQEMLNSEAQIKEAELHISHLESELELNSKVISPYTGRILEQMANAGEVVGSATPIFKLELTGDNSGKVVAVLYLSPTEGKKVKEGMTVQISPTTVKQEEYGFMIGTITNVADFPSTRQGMMRVLKNDQLVRSLSMEGAPFEVFAELEIDPATVSGYKWSSSHGPATRIFSGTLCQGAVVIQEQRPISMVIPILKQSVGI